jgi:hypothetical protein
MIWMETWLKCMIFGVDMKPKMVIGIDIFTDDSTVKTRTVSDLTQCPGTRFFHQ